jgi:anti-sigma factor RsiW
MTEPVPTLWVEKLARGELSPDEAARVRARLGDRAQVELDALRASNEEILRAHPPAEVARAVEERVERERRRRRSDRARARAAVWLLPTAAASAAVLVWLGRTGPSAVVDSSGGWTDRGHDVRAKGDPRLFAHVERGGRLEPLADGEAVRSGARLQLSFDAAGATQGVLLSVDGRGVVTLHAPAEASASPAVAGGRVTLPESYRLDDAPGFERFFLVTGPDVSVDRVVRAAIHAGQARRAEVDRLALPAVWHQETLLLRKE